MKKFLRKAKIVLHRKRKPLLTTSLLTVLVLGFQNCQESADFYAAHIRSEVEAPTPSEPNPVELPANSIVENFKQSEELKKLDILWVIDNSGSMDDEQAALGSNFSSFINDFVDSGIDFKMAITTTDTSHETKRGKMVPGSEKLTSAFAQTEEAEFKKTFEKLVQVGTVGSGYEKGLEASEWFIINNPSYLRKDAYLAVVILSDEEDQSVRSPEEYATILKNTKENAGLVKIYSIVDVKRTNPGAGQHNNYVKYAKASELTNGEVSDIRGNFAQTLSGMSESLLSLLDSFPLSNKPKNGTLQVYVNNVESRDFTYDSVSNSIKFDANSIPPVGANIKVVYKK